MDHEYAASEPADLPGGLYDDAVVTEDATGGLDDLGVTGLDDSGLDGSFETGVGLDDAAGLEIDEGAGLVLNEEADLDIDGSLLDTIEQELADVERALALLDEGTYGQCEHCQGAIDDEVLAATPTARYCAEHLPLSLR